MGGPRGAVAGSSTAGRVTRRKDLVHYLAAREHGLLRRAARRGHGAPDLAQELGEEKATLPVKNQSCELSGQSRATFLMTFSADGTLIASTHGDHTVRVTDVQSGRCRHILTGHPRTPWCIAFHPASNDILASGCLKGEVRIWDLRGGGSERWASEDGSVIASVSFHPTDQVLVIATSHELLFWDWTRPEPFARCKTASKYERVKWVKFDPLGHHLFTAIANTTVPRDENARAASSRVGYINRDAPDSDERRRLRQRYTHIVQQITTHQRDRVLPESAQSLSQTPAVSTAGEGNGEQGEERNVNLEEGVGSDGRHHPPTSTSHIAGMTFSGPHHADIGIVEPQSPVHVEAVETAREYASMVTRNTALSLSNARQYAANVTSASLSSAGDDVEREVIRVRNEHALEEPMEGEDSEEVVDVVGEEPMLEENHAYMQSIDRHHGRTTGELMDYPSHHHSLHDDYNPFRHQPSSMWETRGGSEDLAIATQPTRHSSLSEQQLSTLLTSQSPLGSSSAQAHNRRHRRRHARLAAATPTRLGRNEPQDSILGSLITSTQMSQVQPVGVSSVSATQTPASTGPVVITSYPGIAASSAPSLSSSSLSGGGAFTSILRSRLTTTSVSSSNSGILRSSIVSSSSSSSSAASRTNTTGTGSHVAAPRPSGMSLLRSQLSSNLTSSNTSSTSGTSAPSSNPIITPATTSATVYFPSSFPSSRSVLPMSVSSAFTHTRLTSATRVACSAQPAAITSSVVQPPTVASGSSAASTLQAILQGSELSQAANAAPPTSTAPTVSAADSAASDASRCLVCGHHAVYQSPNSSSHHQHIMPHTPQPVPPPATTGNNNITTNTSTTLEEQALSSALAMSVSTSETTSVAPTGSCRRSSRSRRRAHNTHRLAAFFESEMRQAIDRVRARQLDIRETLQALDQLQNEAGAEGAAPNNAAGTPAAATTGETETNPAPDTAALTLEMQSERFQELLRDSFDVSDLPLPPPPPPPSSTVTAPVTASGANSSAPTGSPQSSSAVTMLSAELNRRIEHLNQLERNVSEITQRLGVRMRSLNDERRRDLGRLRSRISNTQYSLSARLRERQDRLRAHLDEIRQRYRTPGAPRVIPEITVTPSPDEMSTGESTTGPPAVPGAPTTGSVVSEAEAELRGLQEELRQEEQPPEAPTYSRNVNREIENMRTEMVRRRQRERERERTWHSLQRRHLHPHYAVSILDDTINRQNDGLQAAINRAIAGAFMGTGEAAVASNIVNLTHRIQSWDFTRFSIPDITDATSNVLVPHCKLHNDASVDISQDGRYLATFVPSHRGFPDDTILGVFSLHQDTMGQCLFTKSFGPNAISLSLSPLSNYVLVGLAAKRLAWVFTPKQMVAQVYKLKTPEAGEDSMEHICDLMHPCDLDIRSHISVNSARWLPRTGEGVVYGTNRGDLHICRPGDDESDHKSARSVEGDGSESHTIRRNIMQMLGIAVPSTTSTSTQTIHRLRRTASTQTDAPPMADEP